MKSYHANSGVIGMLADGAPKIDLNVLYNSIATVRVVAAGSRAQLIAVNRAIAVNRMQPVIGRLNPSSSKAWIKSASASSLVFWTIGKQKRRFRQ